MSKNNTSGNKSPEITNPMNSELEWIKFRQDTLGEYAAPQDTTGKFIARLKENPFVPIGALATVVALTVGLISMTRGNSKMSQWMMRSRVAAQGFTIVALLVGITIGNTSFTPTGNKPPKDLKTIEVNKNS